MIDVGKRKIAQLKQFHGKMITEALLRDFENIFAPSEEVVDGGDYNQDLAKANISQ